MSLAEDHRSSRSAAQPGDDERTMRAGAGEIAVLVEDTGGGIPDTGHLSKPFVTTKASGMGSSRSRTGPSVSRRTVRLV
ncbi:hypothetical protein CN177_20440 [Sinorhizobium meliloti]|nr:hypothetical protein [Sinorhizobium meliloti]MQX41674.1 hypothetical protein [Sinorhizobium meliloti]MQX60360.1 hypothetical protein [Sinorhizobium meliloti]RVG77094.1 hypothetical protein CN219_30685 [Sinorhizobium meliloti]RVI36132.1 hypothetical protein CN197_12370 [Sinorhizobium meliloti]